VFINEEVIGRDAATRRMRRKTADRGPGRPSLWPGQTGTAGAALPRVTVFATVLSGPAATAAAGVHLVTIDRPGYGRSDHQPGRTVLDWPTDVQELAETLGLARFAVVAHSSGGP
jgi:pimeloyl-ACP methyl ester carboxylesterase